MPTDAPCAEPPFADTPPTEAHSTDAAPSPAAPDARLPISIVPPAWLAAGIGSVALAVAIMTVGGLVGAPLFASAPAGLAIGVAFFLGTAPRRWIARVHDDREALQALARTLRAIDLTDRQEPLHGLVLPRGDEIGDLSRAMHDCLARAIGFRAEARMLQRTMQDAIDRRTRQATAKLKRETTIDALTGVGNRRALGEIVRGVSDQAATIQEHTSQKLIALMIDVDHFKEINDTLGHEAGDECLVFLAELLRSTVRRDDRVVRMGGDEFLILLRDATLEAAESLAARVRALFAQMPWSSEEVGRPTLSIGIAEVPLADGDALDRAVRQADLALYRSKRSGRDRVSVHAAA